MYKEIVISIIILLMVIIGDIITQKYTKKTINELSADSQKLRLSLEKQDIIESKKNLQELEQHINKIHESLSYYIEHDEIEKVETNFTECKSLAEQGEYTLAISKLDKTVFIIEHIKDKYSFSLENIF